MGYSLLQEVFKDFNYLSIMKVVRRKEYDQLKSVTAVNLKLFWIRPAAIVFSAL